MRIAYIGIIIALMMIYVIPSQSIMQFTYECQGKGATATTYSYLREPRSSESNYSIGLKSGSFNYLENGDMNIREDINYYYGNGTNKSNSTLTHYLDVDFEGERGISEFFGRGFFGNNRWISAWKKIRYEDSPTMKVDGWNIVARPSNSIKVHASVEMNSSINASVYAFNYVAKVKNGVIETKDATGWSNRTGSRKYDWEYETRTVGKEINITNILYDSEGLESESGPGDWLPCCFKGTAPMIDQLQYAWPSEVVMATLEADTRLPSKKITSKQVVPAQLAQVAMDTAQFGTIYTKPGLRIGSISSIPETRVIAPGPSVQSKDLYYAKRSLKVGMVTAFQDVLVTTPSANNKTNISIADSPILESCEDGSCDGYDCIYTYDQDSFGATAAGGSATVPLRKGEERKITVTLYGYENSSNTTHPFDTGAPQIAKEEIYNITVYNDGDVPVNGLQVMADMARGMKFVNSIYYGSSRGEAKAKLPPTEFDATKRTDVKWDIGSLQPLEARSILFRAFLMKDVDNTDINVKVNDSALGNVQVRASVNEASILKGCGYFNDVTGVKCRPTNKNKEHCKFNCLDWVIQKF
jgi:hypothetical protein